MEKKGKEKVEPYKKSWSPKRPEVEKETKTVVAGSIRLKNGKVRKEENQYGG